MPGKSTHKKREISVADFYPVFCMVLVFALATFAIQDPDLGFQLALGRFMSEHKRIPLTDVLSFTRYGEPDFVHSLLPAYFFYHLQKSYGWASLILFKALSISLSFLFLYFAAHLDREKKHSNNLVALLLVFLAAIFSRNRFLERPLFLTDFFFAFTLWQCAKFRQSGQNHHLTVLLGAILLWLNVHLGVLVGFVALFSFALSLAIEKKWLLLRRFCSIMIPGVFLVALLSFLANPINRKFWGHIFLMLGNQTRTEYIVELLSGWRFTPLRLGLCLLTALGSCLWLLRLEKNLKKMPLFFMILFGVFTLFASIYAREMEHFFMVWALLVSAVWLRLKDLISKRKFLRLRFFGQVSIPCIILLLFTLELKNPLYAPALALDHRRVPVAGLEIAARHFDPKRVYNSQIYGGWWSFFNTGHGLIFSDGRMPFIMNEFFQKNIEPLIRAAPEWNEILSAHQVDLGFIDLRDPLCRPFYQSKDWGLVYFDEEVAIFLPEGVHPNQPRIQLLNPCGNDRFYWESPKLLNSMEFKSDLNILFSLNPKNPRAFYLLGILYDRQGRTELARDAFYTAGALGGVRSNPWENYALLSCETAHYQDASFGFEQAKTIMIHNPEFWNHWHHCLKKQGKTLKRFEIYLEQLALQNYFRFQ